MDFKQSGGDNFDNPPVISRSQQLPISKQLLNMTTVNHTDALNNSGKWQFTPPNGLIWVAADLQLSEKFLTGYNNFQ